MTTKEVKPSVTAATTVFAFLWMFAPPFQMPYLIEIDPSRRAAVHMATAQLMGIAAGPALASRAVSQSDVRGALAVSAGLYLASALLVFVSSPVWHRVWGYVWAQTAAR